MGRSRTSNKKGKRGRSLVKSTEASASRSTTPLPREEDVVQDKENAQVNVVASDESAGTAKLRALGGELDVTMEVGKRDEACAEQSSHDASNSAGERVASSTTAGEGDAAKGEAADNAREDDADDDAFLSAEESDLAVGDGDQVETLDNAVVEGVEEEQPEIEAQVPLASAPQLSEEVDSEPHGAPNASDALPETDATVLSKDDEPAQGEEPAQDGGDFAENEDVAQGEDLAQDEELSHDEQTDAERTVAAEQADAERTVPAEQAAAEQTVAAEQADAEQTVAEQVDAEAHEAVREPKGADLGASDMNSLGADEQQNEVVSVHDEREPCAQTTTAATEAVAVPEPRPDAHTAPAPRKPFENRVTPPVAAWEWAFLGGTVLLSLFAARMR